MSFYEANFEYIRMMEIFKGDIEWEKAMALFHCLSLRDRETAAHSIEVGYYAAKIAEKEGLDTSRYFLGGLLHDIGKINMSDHPLKSEDRLSKEERTHLKGHVLLGVITLSDLGFGQDIVQFCLRHHERLNGSGYPFGIAHDDLAIVGRIAQVADVFSALTTTRKYRENKQSYTHEEAFILLKEQKGAFDLKIVEILESVILEKQQKEYQYA